MPANSLPLLALRPAATAGRGRDPIQFRDGVMYIVYSMQPRQIRWMLANVRDVSYWKFPYAFQIYHAGKLLIEVEYERKVKDKSPENGWTVWDRTDPASKGVYFPSDDKSDPTLVDNAKAHVERVLAQKDITRDMYDDVEVSIVNFNAYVAAYDAAVKDGSVPAR